MASSEPPLSRRRVNRAVLARQSLLERAAMPLPQMVAAMGFLQAQYAPSMYVGLASRLQALRREQVTTALEDRSLVQGTLLRGTIHLVPRDDYWPVAEAIREPMRKCWLRTTKEDERELQVAADKLRTEFERSPVLTRRDIEQVVAPTRVNGVGFWLEMVRVPPSGTWERRRADHFALAEHWVGPSTPRRPGQGPIA